MRDRKRYGNVKKLRELRKNIMRPTLEMPPVVLIRVGSSVPALYKLVEGGHGRMLAAEKTGLPILVKILPSKGVGEA